MSETFKDRLVRHIDINGPLPLAEFMHWAMYDPKQGYYATTKPIGKDGDFITAPEISQMFGELLGLWAIGAWEALGEPTDFNLVEIGPGRGTLMKDLLRAAKAKPEFLSAAKIHLIETSESLMKTQQDVLKDHADINWHKSIKHLPNATSIVIANELLDVLPIRQYVKSRDQWHERSVGLDDKRALSWVLSTGNLDVESLPEGYEEETDGSVFEISSIREAFIENTAKHILDNGGIALFIDYGHAKSGFGDTLQALRQHEYVEILDEPATADLTAHVDFGALQETARKAGTHTYPINTQGEFLLKLGLLERAGALGNGKSESVQNKIKQEAERLALPDEMGNLFKVFAFSKSKLDLTPFSAD